MNKNRIRGLRWRVSERMIAKPISIKLTGGKSGGCASKAAELTSGDHRNIYVGSERAGQRVMESITRFITHRLKLKVNQAKSAVARPGQRKFLGFSFTRERKPRRRIAPKAIVRFKERIREQTYRTRGISLTQMVKEIATYLRGWLGYFGDCQTALGAAKS